MHHRNNRCDSSAPVWIINSKCFGKDCWWIHINLALKINRMGNPQFQPLHHRVVNIFLYNHNRIRLVAGHLCKLFGWPKYWSHSDHMLCTSTLIGNTLNEPDKWKNVHSYKDLHSQLLSQECVIECCLNGRIHYENCWRQNVSRWITSRKICVAGPLKDRSTTLGMRTRNKARSNLRFVYHQLCMLFLQVWILIGLLEARNHLNWKWRIFHCKYSKFWRDTDVVI